MMIAMMLALVVSAQATPDQSTSLLKSAAGRLDPGCADADCKPAKRRSPYRIADDDEIAPTSKDRAMRNDGTYCQVVGDKYCTSGGRKIFSAPIDK